MNIKYWGFASLWGIAVIGAAIVAASFSIGQSVGIVAPKLAAAQFYTAPNIILRNADMQLNAAADPTGAFDETDFIGPSSQAKKIVLRHPLNAGAFRLLGMQASTAGNTSKAMRYFVASEKISRREVNTQLWLARHHLEKGDIPSALERMDTALRSNRSIYPRIFAAFSYSISDPNFSNQLADYMRQKPAWYSEFVDFLIQNNTEPKDFARLAQTMGGFPENERYRRAEQAIVSGLFGEKDYESLRTYYESLNGVDPLRLTSIDTRRDATEREYPPIGWQTVETATSGAYKRVTNDGLSLVVYIGPNERTTVAKRLIFVSPGTYRYSLATQSSGFDARASANFEISCLEGARADTTIWSGPNLASENGELADDFEIPSDCTVALLSLNADGGSDEGELTIDNLVLQKRQG